MAPATRTLFVFRRPTRMIVEPNQKQIRMTLNSLRPAFLTLLALLMLVALPVGARSDDSLFPQTPPTADSSPAATPSEDFLPPGVAFRVSGSSEGNQLRFQWAIEPGYYLYKHRFSVTPIDPRVSLGEPAFSRAPEPKDDPEFGQVEVFHDDITVTVPVLGTPDGFAEVRVQYQGCAEKGLCYLPQSHTEMFEVTAASASPVTSGPSLVPTPANAIQRQVSAGDTETASGIEALLASSSLTKIMLIFFGLGIALSLTPCVLPMVPILTSLIVGQGQKVTARRGFLLSSTYVAGMAITYTLAGVAAGASGAKIQFWLQDPAVLISTALIFFLLSLSMFGFYELQLPGFIRHRLHIAQHKQSGGGFVGVALMGALSALVVSPCISAPLMGALLYIGKTGDAALGGFALFSMALGMGAPLIALGTTEANMLPKAGAWMENVKGMFGVVLLGVGLWITQHLLPEGMPLMLWGALAMLGAMYLGVNDPHTHAKSKFFKGVGLGAAALGAGLILSGTLVMSGIRTAALAGTQAEALYFVSATTEADLDLALADARDNQMPVMVDVWADWCVACKEMERHVLSRPDVNLALNGYQLIKLDLTDSPDGERLLERFHLQGPPAYLFFDAKGGELKAFHLAGSLSAERFLQHLQSLPARP